MDKLIFLSTRQLAQFDFEDAALVGWQRILVAPQAEVSKLPASMLGLFDVITFLQQVRFDGVLYFYDPVEVKTIINALVDGVHALEIVCFDEGNTDLAHELRCVLGCLTPDCEDPSLFRDKIHMKETLKAAGICIPKFVRLDKENASEESWADMVAKLGQKMVIKPVASAGTNSVFVVDCEDAFVSSLRTIKSVAMDFEAEEYIDGHLFHCDVLLVDGVPLFTECTEYLAAPHLFQQGLPLGGIVLPLDCPLRQKLIEFTLGALCTLRARRGSYHTEIFVRAGFANELVFLECGARPPGMLVACMYEWATGINLLNADVSMRLGHGLNLPEGRQRCAAFYLMYPKGVGTVLSLEKPEIPQSIRVSFSDHVLQGDIHTGCYSNIDYTNSVVAAGEPRQLAKFYDDMKVFKPIIYCQQNV